jgi:hypothetical protein
VLNYIYNQLPLKELNVNLLFILAMSIQRMGLKMEYIAGNMKSMQNNQQIMTSFQKMAALVGGTMNPNF